MVEARWNGLTGAEGAVLGPQGHRRPPAPRPVAHEGELGLPENAALRPPPLLVGHDRGRGEQVVGESRSLCRIISFSLIKQTFNFLLILSQNFPFYLLPEEESRSGILKVDFEAVCEAGGGREYGSHKGDGFHACKRFGGRKYFISLSFFFCFFLET